MLEVWIHRLPGNDDVPLPAYQSEDAAGMDVCAAVTAEVRIEPGQVASIPTGFRIAVPAGFEAQLRPRSGLAAKHAVSLPNTPGTIDPDYRGEVKVLLINLGRETFRVTRGMRIAQMLIFPVPRVAWRAVDELPPTRRGDGGFGHTGV
jgi:dUTP pyrophosphatase